MREPRLLAMGGAWGKRTPSPHLSGYQPSPSPPATTTQWAESLLCHRHSSVHVSRTPVMAVLSDTWPETPNAVCGLPEGQFPALPMFNGLCCTHPSPSQAACPSPSPELGRAGLGGGREDIGGLLDLKLAALAPGARRRHGRMACVLLTLCPSPGLVRAFVG